MCCCGSGVVGGAAEGQHAQRPGASGADPALTLGNLHGFASGSLEIWKHGAAFQKAGKTLHSRVSSLAQSKGPWGLLTRGSEQQYGTISPLTSNVELKYVFSNVLPIFPSFLHHLDGSFRAGAPSAAPGQCQPPPHPRTSASPCLHL